ncbi:hypothetical protein SK128_016354, partial [Halocaridina rubra]
MPANEKRDCALPELDEPNVVFVAIRPDSSSNATAKNMLPLPHPSWHCMPFTRRKKVDPLWCPPWSKMLH